MSVFLALRVMKLDVVVCTICIYQRTSQIAQFLANFSVFRNYQSTIS